MIRQDANSDGFERPPLPNDAVSLPQAIDLIDE
jgi:hypothetical protein